MSYLVLARKYRPQIFKDIIGQSHITQTLQNSISTQRVGHAYLFSGPRGVGKTSTARIFAKALNCKKGSNSEPCNNCIICSEISSGFSLDVIEIDGASNRGIDEIRALRENVKFAPTSYKYKVYIIDEVHMVTTPAFNALLKTLEEPPAHVVFIFATTECHKVPSTILSRCQRFNFRQVSLDEIVRSLKQIVKLEKVEIDEDALYLIAKNAYGSLRDALTILDEVISLNPERIIYENAINILGIIDYRILIDFGEIIAEKDVKKGLVKIEELVNSGYDVSQFVKDLREHFRNLLMIKVTDISASTSDFSSLINLDSTTLKSVELQSKKFSQSDLLTVIDILSNLEGKIKYSDQKRLLLEISMTKLCSAFISLNQILEKIEILERKLNEQSKSLSIAVSTAQLNITEEKKQNSPSNNSNYECQEPVEPIDLRGNTSTEKSKQNDSVSFSDELEELKNKWNSILKLIDNKKGSLKSFLGTSQPVEIINGIITLAFNKDDKFCKESVDRKENKELISKSIQEIMHKKFKIKCILVDEQITPVREHSHLTGKHNGIKSACLRNDLDHQDGAEFFSNGVNKNLESKKSILGDKEEKSFQINVLSEEKQTKEENDSSLKTKVPYYSPKEIVNREPIIEKALDIFGGEIAEID